MFCIGLHSGCPNCKYFLCVTVFLGVRSLSSVGPPYVILSVFLTPTPYACLLPRTAGFSCTLGSPNMTSGLLVIGSSVCVTFMLVLPPLPRLLVACTAGICSLSNRLAFSAFLPVSRNRSLFCLTTVSFSCVAALFPPFVASIAWSFWVVIPLFA